MNLLCRELELLNYDIFLLQETHVSCKSQAEAIERVWRGDCFWSFGTGKSVDKFHSNDFHSSEKTCLAAVKADFSLVEVCRKLNPHGISFSWSNSSNSQASRLDRFFISQTLLKGYMNVVLHSTMNTNGETEN